ncbi:MAG: NADPH:quinone oxidoreductase family protein [Hahellaceae bacterium]|nr:NADPH:quinone oxidoreductase family protein [Hahellaceae bacterium]
MRAWLCKSFGPPETLVLEETAEPRVGSGSVLVRVSAAGLNFPDSLIIEGKYQFKPSFPFSPGGEVAGIVEAVGEKVSRFKVGDRVMGLTGWGGFAEKIAVGEANLVPVPPSLSDESAAGFMMIYGTSMYALKQRGRLEEGQTLLVLGAGGGVGKAAVEIGKAMGAKVIAAASSAEKLAVAKRAGADELINYSESNLKDELKRLTKGQGVDVVYDPVGGELAEQALRSMAWDGRYLVVGFASGTIPSFAANLTLLKGCQIVGVFWGAFAQRSPLENLANFKELLGWVQAGKIDPSVAKVYPFEEAAQAIADLGGRRVSGKAVVRVS